ncbi:hypothetical protein VPHK394_0038 [Vibrio phage K394]
MSGKIVRPHMGVEAGEEFVDHVKATMAGEGCDRDSAIKHILWESRCYDRLASYYRALQKQYRELEDSAHDLHVSNVKLNQAVSIYRRENRKLYMVIAILSVACVTLALM